MSTLQSTLCSSTRARTQAWEFFFLKQDRIEWYHLSQGTFWNWSFQTYMSHMFMFLQAAYVWSHHCSFFTGLATHTGSWDWLESICTKVSLYIFIKKLKGRKSVNMIQDTLSHKMLFQRLHHLSFIFGYSIYTALHEFFLRSLHSIRTVVIISIDTNCYPPIRSVDNIFYPLRFISRFIL